MTKGRRIRNSAGGTYVGTVPLCHYPVGAGGVDTEWQQTRQFLKELKCKDIFVVAYYVGLQKLTDLLLEPAVHI